MRCVVLACALMLGAAAPARAWCEAMCLAPSAAGSHCPSHDPVDGTTNISAGGGDDCPVIESARPPIPVRLDVHTAGGAGFRPEISAPTNVARSFVRPQSATTVFQRGTPLRI
jgi:hypothetical protein